MRLRVNAKKYFLPYQLEWLADRSRIKIWEKSRRIGATYVQSYEDVEDCIFDRLKRKKIWFSSADESAAREYIDYCAMWARLFDKGARELGAVVIDSERDINALAIEFSNGYKINALTSNPKKFRSKGGKVVLDEFAHHDDQAAMWKAAKPSAMWGDPIRILSTHHGKGLFFKFTESVRQKKLDWSLHTTDIYTGIKQGLLNRMLGHEAKEDEINEWLANERRDAFDEITWLEEYEVKAQEEGDRFLTRALIAGCEDRGLMWEQDIIPVYWNGKTDDIAEPDSIRADWVNSKLKQFEEWYKKIKPMGNLYLGYDIGRKKDLAVLWLTERIMNTRVTRLIIVLEQMKFWVQERLLHILLNHRKFHRACIDETGIGMMLAENAQDKFGIMRVEKVSFTLKSKSEMAYILKRNFENRSILIPPDDAVRDDLNSVKKITTASNNIRLTKADDDKDVSGHADRFWALALNLYASEEEFFPVTVSSRKKRESYTMFNGY